MPDVTPFTVPVLRQGDVLLIAASWDSEGSNREHLDDNEKVADREFAAKVAR